MFNKSESIAALLGAVVFAIIGFLMADSITLFVPVAVEKKSLFFFLVQNREVVMVLLGALVGAFLGLAFKEGLDAPFEQ